jgi:hypothetical protein
MRIKDQATQQRARKFFRRNNQQPQEIKNSGTSFEPWPNFLPPPGAKTGTATLFQIAANVFEKLFRVACSVSFDARKTL